MEEKAKASRAELRETAMNGDLPLGLTSSSGPQTRAAITAAHKRTVQMMLVNAHESTGDSIFKVCSLVLSVASASDASTAHLSTAGTPGSSYPLWYTACSADSYGDA
jgi:hypothetical protein